MHPEHAPDVPRERQRGLSLLPKRLSTWVRAGVAAVMCGLGAEGITSLSRAPGAEEPSPSPVQRQYVIDGFDVAETPNFRVQAKNVSLSSARVAAMAESVRTEVRKKFFADRASVAPRRCTIHVYPHAAAVPKEVGFPPTSPGLFSYKWWGSGYTARAIHVRCDVPHAVSAVLPHETVHAVLREALGDDMYIPRWYDEGCAMQVEPYSSRREREEHFIAAVRGGKPVPSLESLLTMMHYPASDEQAKIFYGQSAALMAALKKRGGSDASVTEFMKTGVWSGYGRAAQQLGYRDLAEINLSMLSDALASRHSQKPEPTGAVLSPSLLSASGVR